MKYSEITLSVLFVCFFVIFFFSRKSNLEKNKAISVGIITSYTSYKEISYKFRANDELQEKSINQILSIDCIIGDKFLVVYDSINPHTSFLMLKYLLPNSFKLGDDLRPFFNKDTISVSALRY